MSEKKKFQIEFVFNISVPMLYERLSTPAGLAEWFADDVNIKDGNLKFIWDGSEQEAKVIKRKKNELIRFKWLDDEEESTYFEFYLKKDELTNEVALIITDFSDAADLEENKDLWHTQMKQLQRRLGM